MSDETWLEGAISIEAALTSGNREIFGLFVRQDKWDRSIRHLAALAAKADVSVERVHHSFLEDKVSGKTHGGVIARVGQRRFVSLSDLVVKEKRPVIFMLDGVEDPFNFGQAVRALYSSGVDGLVVRPRNWLSAAAVVARASAGASERMPMAIADSAEAAADFFARQGLTIACTSTKRARTVFEADLTVPLFVLIGGEKRGITRSFLQQADLRLKIPYEREFAYSLGTAVSASILSFEIMRQRSLV